MKKSAFTFIELIFVVIVLGILASIAMDKTSRDLKQEASETILSHIRLAQQLALKDNKHRSDNNPLWQKAYWRFEYGKCRNTDKYYYRVGSDVDLDGAIDKKESAVNPLDGKYLYTVNTCDSMQDDESSSVLLGKKFGIRRVEHSGGCSKAQHIAFDYLGRPHHQIASYKQPDFSKYMTSNCNLKFFMSTDVNNDGIVDDRDSFTIVIESETGHAFIVGQEDL